MKTYLVTLENPVDEQTAEQFAKGVQLHNEKDLTKPARLEVLTPTEVRLTISEGRYHQVKRMFAAVGNHVVGLHRERIGDIMLDESLERRVPPADGRRDSQRWPPACTE